MAKKTLNILETHSLLYLEILFAKFAPCVLGFEPAIVPGMAARTMAYDLTSKTWSLELFAYAGIATAQLSQVLPSGTIVGEISKTTAERLRLPLGIKVAVGGHDRPMGDLGAGIARPGSVVACSIGTAIGAILVAGTARGIAVRFLVR